MVSRFVRLLIASLGVAAAICLAPAQSKADIQILVEELDASSKVVGKSLTTGSAPSQAFTYSDPAGFFTLNGFSLTNSSLGSLNASLTTSFSGGFTSNFEPMQGHTLRITITDDNYTSNGLGVTLTNGASVPLDFPGGILQIDATSRIFDPSLPGATGLFPASSTTDLADGATVAGPTGTATDSFPTGDPALRSTQVTTTGLPSTYAIQQEILVSITQTGEISQSDLFSGVGQARVLSTPDIVPAPGGLMLAMIALPLFGVRRLIRKREEPTA